MKTHAIIPIFIPHLGCPYDCIFCNQKAITAKQKPLPAESVRTTVDTWLSTLDSVPNREIAFYGGSFTAIPMEMQREYLKIAKEYKDGKKVEKLHLSTRPDAIDERILENLKNYGVDVIELGVQSFDDEVLRLSGRGHDAQVIYKSAELIKAYGFQLGIQLMIGLPKDSLDTCIFSAEETVKIAPDIARLYPTVVIKDTELYNQALEGRYVPLSEKEAILRTKEMYKILTGAGINIIRVGLKSSDLIAPGGLMGGGDFHPAFRQLVEGEIAKEIIEERLRNLLKAEKSEMQIGDVSFFANPASFSNMVGNGGRNKKYFAEIYPKLNIRYKVCNDLKPGCFDVKITK